MSEEQRVELNSRPLLAKAPYHLEAAPSKLIPDDAHFPANIHKHVAEIGRHDTEGGMLQGDTYGAQFAFKNLMIH